MSRWDLVRGEREWSGLNVDLSKIKWPDHKEFIAGLNLDLKMQWYALQDARDMVYLGDTQEFKAFWYWHYLFPLRMKRLMYRFKFW